MSPDSFCKEKSIRKVKISQHLVIYRWDLVVPNGFCQSGDFVSNVSHDISNRSASNFHLLHKYPCKNIIFNFVSGSLSVAKLISVTHIMIIIGGSIPTDLLFLVEKKYGIRFY